MASAKGRRAIWLAVDGNEQKRGFLGSTFGGSWPGSARGRKGSERPVGGSVTRHDICFRSDVDRSFRPKSFSHHTLGYVDLN